MLQPYTQPYLDIVHLNGKYMKHSKFLLLNVWDFVKAAVISVITYAAGLLEEALMSHNFDYVFILKGCGFALVSFLAHQAILNKNGHYGPDVKEPEKPEDPEKSESNNLKVEDMPVQDPNPPQGGGKP